MIGRIFTAFVILGALFVVAFGVLVLFMAMTTPGNAQDRGAWFKSLKQPLTGASCCDISDCRQTKAEWRGNQWWADVQGEWMAIPPEKVLRNKPSIDGEAYVCSGYARRIYCFVEPTMGY